jgi:hypothetical protein
MDSRPTTDPLTLVAIDTERYVARAGWDQPARLFALVPTVELVRREPQLGRGLATHDTVEGALSAVEQDDLPDADRLADLLGGITWPGEVAGCAIAVERVVLSPADEHDLPEDPAAGSAPRSPSIRAAKTSGSWWR